MIQPTADFDVRDRVGVNKSATKTSDVELRRLNIPHEETVHHGVRERDEMFSHLECLHVGLLSTVIIAPSAGPTLCAHVGQSRSPGNRRFSKLQIPTQTFP